MNKEEDLINYYQEEFNLSQEEISILEGEKLTVKIPKRVESNLKHFHKEIKAAKIHSNLTTAKELIYLFLDNFKGTFRIAENSDDIHIKEGYKILHHAYLKKQLQYDSRITSPYVKVKNFLLENGFIIQGRNYTTGDEAKNIKSRSTEYRLADRYYGVGIIPYPLKSKEVRRLRNKRFNIYLKSLFASDIGRNSLKTMSLVQFPEESKVIEILEDAIKKGYKNKKGKPMKKLGKHSIKEEGYSRKDFIFMEDYLKIFRSLTQCFKCPIVRNGAAGGRVYDSFNMMPAIIREHITLNNQPIVEGDFASLHPNIAQSIYGGTNTEQITHDKVAQELYNVAPTDAEYSEKRQEVKIEHLSFFNKNLFLMMQSPLFDYYEKKQPQMMSRIKNYKEVYGSKSTSKDLFDTETILMSNIIKRLHKDYYIDVLYCFDALYFNEVDKEDVITVMNEEALKLKILSTAN